MGYQYEALVIERQGIGTISGLGLAVLIHQELGVDQHRDCGRIKVCPGVGASSFKVDSTISISSFPTARLIHQGPVLHLLRSPFQLSAAVGQVLSLESHLRLMGVGFLVGFLSSLRCLIAPFSRVVSPL